MGHRSQPSVPGEQAAVYFQVEGKHLYGPGAPRPLVPLPLPPDSSAWICLSCWRPFYNGAVAGTTPASSGLVTGPCGWAVGRPPVHVFSGMPALFAEVGALFMGQVRPFMGCADGKPAGWAVPALAVSRVLRSSRSEW